MITSREGNDRNLEVRLEIEILIIVPCIKIAKLFEMIIIRRYFSNIIYMRNENNRVKGRKRGKRKFYSIVIYRYDINFLPSSIIVLNVYMCWGY